MEPTEPTFRLVGTEHTFTPFGGPLDQPAPNALLEDIGRAIMVWARLEYIMTALAIHINKQAASSILHNPNPSSKLGDMVKLVRKWLTKHEEFTHLRTQDDSTFFEVLLKEINIRNELVHGLLESVDVSMQTFTMRRIKRSGKDKWSTYTTTYRIEVPKHLASQGTLAARHFTEICKVVFEESQTP